MISCFQLSWFKKIAIMGRQEENLSEMNSLDKMSSVTADMNSRYISSSSLLWMKCHSFTNRHIVGNGLKCLKMTYSVVILFIIGDFLPFAETLKYETLFIMISNTLDNKYHSAPQLYNHTCLRGQRGDGCCFSSLACLVWRAGSRWH